MKQRLEQFLSAENLTKSQFADSINVARAAITHIIAGRNNPSYDFIINTMAAYPDLNIEWLLQGRGKMYKDNVVSEPKSQASPINTTQEELLFNSHEDTIEEKSSQTPEVQPIEAIKSMPGTKIRKIVVFFDNDTYQEFC